MKKALADVFLVGSGGILGSLLRYAIEGLLSGSPEAVLLVNLTGSLAIGFIGVLVLEYGAVSSRGRLFWAVGFLGGYTTFSSFILGLGRELHQGRYLPAVLYLLASYGGGLLAVLAGTALPKLLLERGFGANTLNASSLTHSANETDPDPTHSNPQRR